MNTKESIDLKILKAIFGIASSIGSELELKKVCDLIVEKVFKVINCNGNPGLLRMHLKASVRCLLETGILSTIHPDLGPRCFC